MRALVVYESMYGNTRAVAKAIAEGLRESCDVDVVAVDGATPALVAAADLLVVGGPTHMHGLARASSRRMAAQASQRPGGPVLDPDAGGIGLREWLDTLTGGGRTAAAVFDTRFGGLSLLTGRAGLGIARALRRRGFGLVTAPKSFIVDKQNHVLPGEIEHATQWGRHIAPALQQRAGGTAR
ncbi:MAG TPA: flavodoxin domain-containing protein [Actinocrinis sp.]|nr:flavodoxin domain-containing protein [Actinocrinis sp.]